MRYGGPHLHLHKHKMEAKSDISHLAELAAKGGKVVKGATRVLSTELNRSRGRRLYNFD